MIGFFFNNRHSKEFNLSLEDAHRPLLPERRRNDYEITGRNGTVNFGGETYATRQITVDIAFIADNVHNLQLLAREIAHWLSGRGILYFDDEPTRAYDAIVYNSIDTEQLIRFKRASVVFECQPFAKSINFLQRANQNIESGHIENITSEGTHSTDSIIIFITNNGEKDISNIKISRRALTS